jgi:hypothetical protein
MARIRLYLFLGFNSYRYSLTKSLLGADTLVTMTKARIHVFLTIFVIGEKYFCYNLAIILTAAALGGLPSLRQKQDARMGHGVFQLTTEN